MEASHVDWETINEQLVYDHSEESHARRREIWNAMNCNDNKYLCLAEVDRGIRDVSLLENHGACSHIDTLGFGIGRSI